MLYTGSSDQHVVEWEVAKQQSHSKWKADKHCVTCVCCHDDDELLLSAGCVIKLWSLTDHTLLKVRCVCIHDPIVITSVCVCVPCAQRFTGHSTRVRDLRFVPSTGDTFLSIADGDRIINFWLVSLLSVVTI